MTATEKATTNAVSLAESLIPFLSGWTLDDNTRRAISEGDTFTRHWAGLSTLLHPGAEMTLNTSHHEGMISISVSYPKNWEPYIDGRGRVYRESIKVGITKAPEKIAKDIQRRIFDATDYLARVAECMRRKAESENAADAAETLARELAAIVKTTTEEDRQRAYHASSRKPYDFNSNADHRRTFTAWPNTSGSRVEVKVSHGGKTATVELRDISPELARQILILWQDARNSTDRTEEGE